MVDAGLQKRACDCRKGAELSRRPQPIHLLNQCLRQIGPVRMHQHLMQHKAKEFEVVVARQQALAGLLHKRRKAGGPAGIGRTGGLQHQLVLIQTRGTLDWNWAPLTVCWVAAGARRAAALPLDTALPYATANMVL